MNRLSPRNPPVWLLAGALMAVLTPALLLNNFHYIFRYDLYEFEDLAADSLQILKAKSFHEIYGQYSRWGFHHPGPAFFYVQAWGELFFYDWWHLVPRPLNAQMLATVLLNVFFMSVALATAARWVGARTVFLPLALGLAVLQIAAIAFYGPDFSALMLFGNWPAYFLVVPFTALLVVLASVAAGRGESLPFAALTGCFLVHGHIAQATFFVLPLCALAYAGLILSCRSEADFPSADPAAKPWKGFLARPWRMFPRAHIATAAIVAIFVLPILIDLGRGGQSNIARILAVRRATAGEPHKTLMRSLLYFLQYGGDQWYHRLTSSFDGYTTHGVWEYFANTRVVWEFRALGALAALAVMASWLRRGNAVTGEAPEEDSIQAAARRRYTVWLAVFTVMAAAITVVWGCIMNGDMYYLNAYFNFGIYYVGMLVAAAATADFVCTMTSSEWNGRGLKAFLYAAVGVLAAFNADSFRLKGYAHSPGLSAIAANVAEVLHNEPSTAPRARYLSFYTKDVALAVNIAVQLERTGHPCLTARTWEIFFGESHCPAEPIPPGGVMNGKLPFLCWKIVPASEVPAGVAVHPLFGDLVLMSNLESIDPALGSEIRFGGPTGNDTAYTTFGWSDPEQLGSAHRFSGAKQSMLSFRAKPVPAGSSVHVTFDCVPFVLPDKKPVQRMEVSLDNTQLGTWRRSTSEPVELSIPASVWNAQENAWLLLSFPDAATPASLGFNTDSRTVAFSFRRIGFRVEPGPPAGSP